MCFSQINTYFDFNQLGSMRREGCKEETRCKWDSRARDRYFDLLTWMVFKEKLVPDMCMIFKTL